MEYSPERQQERFEAFRMLGGETLAGLLDLVD
jgi:hypothetical protein